MRQGLTGAAGTQERNVGGWVALRGDFVTEDAEVTRLGEWEKNCGRRSEVDQLSLNPHRLNAEGAAPKS